MLQIRRHDGKTGMPFSGRDRNGNKKLVAANGCAAPERLVKESSDDGKILTVSGDLAALASFAAARGSKPGVSQYTIEILSKPPTVLFAIRSDEFIERAVLKTALHFVAGFVSDVPAELTRSILPMVAAGVPLPRGSYVRSSSFSQEATFTRRWPPRHELRYIPGPDCVYVAVLLFGACPYACRLPMLHRSSEILAYVQPLIGNVSPQLSVVPHSSQIDWDNDVSTKDPGYPDEVASRMNEIGEHSQISAFRERIKSAAFAADSSGAQFGNCWERFRAELQLQCFSAEEVEQIMRLSRLSHEDGKEVWEFPIEPSNNFA